MKHLNNIGLVGLLLSAAAIAEAPATMRVDFFHTGNSETEIFSLEQVVIEPLPWTGNMHQPIDKTLRGKYLFEIADAETGNIAWSRSFSSIYGEWETTAEARQMNRTLHESVRFPAQDTRFDLVLKKRDPMNEFQEIWRIPIDPNDYMVHRESALYEDQVVAILDNGDPAQKVDLLLLGDGYTADEFDDFIDKARELTDILFATSPFKERKDDFNVWALAPAAADSGISRPSTNTYRDSPIGTTYDVFRSERYVLTFDNKAMRRIASSTPYDFIEILTNTETEFGHHFAGLADEYYTSSVAYEAPLEITEPYEPNVTALLDSESLKWKHLVGPITPTPTPWPKAEFEEHSMAYQERRRQMRADNVPEAQMNELFRSNQNFIENLFARSEYRDAVGAFEGANYQAQGYYRSEQNCLMFTRTDYFCLVCRAAIDKVIDEYTLALD
jgi:hypothetical protein